MKTSTYTALLALTSIGAIATPAHSQDLVLQYPLVSGDNNGVTSFDPTTGLYQMTSGPTIVKTDAASSQMYIFPDTGSGTRNMSLQFTYDSVAGTIDGAAGNDFELIGSIDTDGDFVPDITGVLLTGEIIDFSFEDNGTTDVYDFRFEVTGGEIADWFPTGNFGIVNISENSSFTGSFDAAFSGEGKATLGAIETIVIDIPEEENSDDNGDAVEEEEEEETPDNSCDDDRDYDRDCGRKSSKNCDDRDSKSYDRNDRDCNSKKSSSYSNRNSKNCNSKSSYSSRNSKNCNSKSSYSSSKKSSKNSKSYSSSKSSKSYSSKSYSSRNCR